MPFREVKQGCQQGQTIRIGGLESARPHAPIGGQPGHSPHNSQLCLSMLFQACVVERFWGRLLPPKAARGLGHLFNFPILGAAWKKLKEGKTPQIFASLYIIRHLYRATPFVGRRSPEFPKQGVRTHGVVRSYPLLPLSSYPS